MRDRRISFEEEFFDENGDEFLWATESASREERGRDIAGFVPMPIMRDGGMSFLNSESNHAGGFFSHSDHLSLYRLMRFFFGR